jgi:prolyl-tRNA synthetase
MKDAYSLDAEVAGLDKAYDRIVAAYERIFSRCGLEAVRVEADSGMMGGAASHEFVLPHANGEDTIVQCTACAYAANVEHATFRLPERDADPLAEMSPIETPGCRTIADVASFVGVPAEEILKAVFYASDTVGLVFVVIRGDLDINERKLENLLGVADLRAATDVEIRATGSEPGYASPVGLHVRETREGPGVLVIGDQSIEAGGSFVAGANRPGYHLTGVVPKRDFTVALLADVAQARTGLPCPRCDAPLTERSAIELGHCFKLGTRYSTSTGATFLDTSGDACPIVMGSYGIGVGRLLAAVIESHHDAHGIIWPPSLAPCSVHLLNLGTGENVRAAAAAVYAQLRARGHETLFDDREESAGVKFADADLIGCPVRATVSRRSLKGGGIELKARWESERLVVPADSVVEEVERMLGTYFSDALPPASVTMRS